jgi:hypothetical protein
MLKNYAMIEQGKRCSRTKHNFIVIKLAFSFFLSAIFSNQSHKNLSSKDHKQRNKHKGIANR